MKTLVLCRHAKSSWKYDVPDITRPLNKRGMIQAPEMAKTCYLTPDLVLCSPAVRAWSTVVFYFQLLNWDYNLLKITPQLYEASLDRLIWELQDLKESNEIVFLFGHNPGLNLLISFLIGHRTTVLNLVTSGRVIMELDIVKWQDIGEHCASIIEWEVPKGAI